MQINEKEIAEFVEPIFRFCIKRLNNRHDAEDLASEIMVHILNGVQKYTIDSLEKWVWRIAYNRYARFIDKRNKRSEILQDSFYDVTSDYDFVNDMLIAQEYQQIFMYLHTLSSEYRNILVDYYIGQQPVKQIGKNYGLSETTVKWRLNISRKKIQSRIGENKMDKVYKPINWHTASCNGNMDSNQYLHSQISRAICEAAYEKSLTIEEISLKTGLPTMYIEDELPRLIYGDAIAQEGNKYSTDFIVLRQCDTKVMKTAFAPLVDDVTNYFAELFAQQKEAVANMDFYGSNFGMERLGYIALPAVLRAKINKACDGANLQVPPFPPRKDGGYGWFLVFENPLEGEPVAPFGSGCNAIGNESHRINYYFIGKYFSDYIYHNGGTTWLADKDIISKTVSGVIPVGILTEDDEVRLLKANLIVKDDGAYKLNFAIFAPEQFAEFRGLFDRDNTKLHKMLTDLIISVHKSFKAFVPKRLDSQINQYVQVCAHNIIGYVAEELINRNVLETPDSEKPLTNGVFCILDGKYCNV